MKIENARVTMLINKESTELEIYDSIASLTIVRVIITAEQLSLLLSRMAMVQVESVEVFSLDKIGKQHENKDFVFEITEKEADFSNRDNMHEIALQKLAESEYTGWTPDNYYNSQRSFFRKDGKHYAQCTIRRWI